MAEKKKLSTADVLAMARKQGPVGDESAAAPPQEKPAAKAPAPEKPAPAKKPAADGDGAKPAPKKSAAVRDTASILAAARTSARLGPMTKAEAATKQQEAPAKPKGTVPPMPPKPDYAKPIAAKSKPAPAADETRRGILGALFGSFLGLGFTSLAGTNLLWTLGFARFMFPNVLNEPPNRFKVGFPDDFAPGQVSEKFKAQFGVWLVNGTYNGQPQIYALRTVCTHLGCTPNWLEAEQKFKCPCHGSGFYKDGVNFEGPAPRPLERYAIAMASTGEIEVDKSRMFQEELGQWSDSDSFVTV